MTDFETFFASNADLYDERAEDEARDAYFESLEEAPEYEWGLGPEPYEPSPYDGTYSEM